MEKMDKALSNKLECFRKAISQAGEDIVFHSFPNKILYISLPLIMSYPTSSHANNSNLTELIESTKNSDSPFHISHTGRATDTTVYPPPSVSPTSAEPQTKKRKLENELPSADRVPSPSDTKFATFPSRVSANQHMAEKIHDIVKKESEDLASLVDQVKLWVTLTLPKIEDGDNFGVQIQEEVLGELHRSQESAYNIRDATRQDYIARAKLCSKLIKYPNVEDYKLALREHDDRQLFLARQHIYDIRNVYAVLTDLIHKNISKIRSPKANNSIGLY